MNEVGIDSVPDGLKKAFEDGKKVLFLINPPYGTASKQGKISKDGMANTALNVVMKKDKIGSTSQQLYAQFMYKILSLKNNYNDISVGIYSKLAFMTSGSFRIFRKKWYDTFEFQHGMIFQASNFSDVSSLWGISFTLWKNAEQTKNIPISLDMKAVTDNFYSIENIGKKMIYESGEKAASKWVREGVDFSDKRCVPNLKSAVNVSSKTKTKMPKNAIAFFICDANIVEKNSCFVVLQSLPSSNNNGKLPVDNNNYNKVVALFAARKSIKGNWVNDKDEYLVPNTEHTDYEQWNDDAIVYSLFNNSSQQSSLRDIDYKDKKWDIVNNFFFMSNAEMRELANTNNYLEMYQDTKAFAEDRYVYNLLQTTILSDDAQQVLDMARELVKKSFEEREDYNDEYPKYQLQCWDAGWAQLKPMLKERYKEEYNAFVKAYKEFEDRMRKGVYKFGFLKS